MNSYDESLKDLNEAIALHPDEASNYSDRGNAYIALRRYEDALTDFNRAVELNPAEANYYNDRGNAYNALRRHEDALADFNRAIELNPDDANYYINRGNVYDMLHRYEEGLADFNRAIELAPKFSSAFNSRGLLKSHLGQYDKAINDYERALSLDKGGFVYIYNIAVAKVLSKKDPKVLRKPLYDARKALEKALSDPDMKGAALYGLGGLAAVEGDKPKALEYLSQALALDPEAESWVKQDVAWEGLRNDPEFLAVIKK